MQGQKQYYLQIIVNADGDVSIMNPCAFPSAPAPSPASANGPASKEKKEEDSSKENKENKENKDSKENAEGAIPEKQKHQLKHRELFLSRQVGKLTM